MRQTERDRRSGVPEGVSFSSSAGAVSRCRQSGYKQKVFSPLTSSTGPSAGRRHRNAYSQGVTATVCHQSVRLAVLPADNASTRAQLRFIMEGVRKKNKKQKQTGMMKYTQQRGKPFNFIVRPDGGWFYAGRRGEKCNDNILKISVVHRIKYFSLVCHYNYKCRRELPTVSECAPGLTHAPCAHIAQT